MKFKGLSGMKVKKRSNSCSAGDQRFISGPQPVEGIEKGAEREEQTGRADEV